MDFMNVFSSFLGLAPQKDPKELEKIGISSLIEDFVRNMCLDHASTIVNFPLEDVLSSRNLFLPLSPNVFHSEIQRQHALEMCRRVPELEKLKNSICPHIKTEAEFWMIYFFLLSNKIGSILDPDGESKVEKDWLFREMNSSSSTFSKIFIPNVSSESESFKITPNYNWENTNGFKDEEKYSNTKSQDYIRDELNRLREWSVLDLSKILSTSHQKEQRKYIKSLLFRGVPDRYRQQVWRKLSGSSSVLINNKNYYTDVLLRFLGSQIPKVCKTVASFGGVFPAPRHEYCLTSDGRNSLKRVLIALSLENNFIEYSPVIPELVCICLHFMSEELAFATINVLIKKTTPNRIWVVPNKYAFFVLLKTFDSMVQAFYPEVYQHLSGLGIKLIDVSEVWFGRFFVGTLPLQEVLRIFDVWVLEGCKTLFRVAMRLINVHKEQLLQLTTKEKFNSIFDVYQQSVLGRVPYSYSQNSLDWEKESVKFKTLRGLMLESMSVVQEIAYYKPYRHIISTPVVLQPSSIIDQDHWETLFSWLPSRQGYRSPKLLYSTLSHGFSISTLYTNCLGKFPTLIFVKSEQQRIFGVYIANPWKISDSYFGDGETFVFSLYPYEMFWSWKPSYSEYFMRTEKDSITFGGSHIGKGGTTLWLDDELLNGSSDTSSTFYNLPLNGTKTQFRCLLTEVYQIC